MEKKRGKKPNWSSKYPWGPFKWEVDDSKLTLQNTLKTSCQQCTWGYEKHENLYGGSKVIIFNSWLQSWMSSNNNVYEIRQKQAHSKSHALKLYNHGNVANVTNQIRNIDSQHHFNKRRTFAYSNPSILHHFGWDFCSKQKISALSGSPSKVGNDHLNTPKV